ncbi:DUF2919 family protein [Candidatus Colwellia aromaticivorans]|uniref:DUF2919 family protein n=1 Tax=Candidatus Colwellia aromaticivorans TaxID=2267621 RepID=UPI000DF29711|nr:DUF2919 family protein [Candidatus Colwellia aromaticivorans]
MSQSSKKYQQYSVQDFDNYDCLKLSKRFYLVLLFVLRGYLVWLMSVTNMRDRVSVISWIYPETSLFYLSLISGAVGLFVVLIISLRRPEAANWVKISWQHSRKILIAALLFDLLTHGMGFFYWQLISVEWLIMQAILTITLIILCYNSERFTINLTEFPQKIPEK